MITFKQFLAEEVVTSKRKSMLHLQNMKPLEFLDWVQSLDSNFGGVLSNLEVSLKVDGLGARFGKDEAGRFFFEGSRTGPVFEPKAFSTYAKSKGSKQEIVDRAAHYDDMFDALKGSQLVKSLPPDTKVICEIFYNPMAEDAGQQLKFVSVKYDKSKLGKTMTIIPISVIQSSSGEDHENEKDVLKALYKASTADVKVVDPNLKVGSIDVRATTQSVLKFGEKERAIIKSLKGADKDSKAILIATIQKAKDELADLLLNHPSIVGKDKLGKELEGLVFTAGNQPVKVTTQAFKDSKKAERTA